MTEAAIVDLRSDTVTRPGQPMRRVIAEAEVGDDALGDDPTVRRLEARVAELLGKEAALFCPSGIMANQAALMSLAPPGTEVLLEGTAHILDWEDGAPAQWGSLQLRPVRTPGGLLDADLVAAGIRPPSDYQIRTSLICLENTHNAAGGRVLPLQVMRAIRDVADEHRLPIHLDGARLWNAAVASGVPEADYAAVADTVMVALSKGLGCPVGSVLAGSDEVIRRARRVRRRLGGAMRQAGVLAAAGLYALDHHRDRLADDHRRAAALAHALEAAGLSVVRPETNILMVDVPDGPVHAAAVAAAAAEQGVLVAVFAPRRLRAVTHLDIDDAAIARAADVLLRALG